MVFNNSMGIIDKLDKLLRLDLIIISKPFYRY